MHRTIITFKALLTSLLLLASQTLIAQVTYTYTGNNFVDVSGTITTSMAVTASVELPAALTAGTHNVSATLTDYTFSDGVHTLTPANSQACLIEFTVNGSGAITHWRAYVRTAPTPPLNSPAVTIDTNFQPAPPFPMVADNFDAGAEYLSDGSSGCLQSVPIQAEPIHGYISDSPGTWVSPAAPVSSAEPIPTLSQWGLIISSLLLLGFGMVAHRRLVA